MVDKKIRNSHVFIDCLAQRTAGLVSHLLCAALCCSVLLCVGAVENGGSKENAAIKTRHKTIRHGR